MADFCVKCHEKFNGVERWAVHPKEPWRYDLGDGLCEGCAEWRNDIVFGIDASPIRMAIQYFRYKKGEYGGKE